MTDIEVVRPIVEVGTVRTVKRSGQVSWWSPLVVVVLVLSGPGGSDADLPLTGVDWRGGPGLPDNSGSSRLARGRGDTRG